MNIENVKIVTWEEIEPDLFPDQPDVLDELGLTEQRKKMTAAQNDMIKLKHDIRRELETGYLTYLKDQSDPKPEEPFNFNVDKTPDIDRYVHEKMARALNLSALRDPKYRMCAKEYLEALTAAVSKKEGELIGEIDRLSEELSKIQDEYQEKIHNLTNKLNSIRHGVGIAADRFYLTDTGSATQGGFTPCEQPDPGLWIRVYKDKNDVDTYLDTLMGVITDLDLPQKDSDRINIAKSNVKTCFRDGSGSNVPAGGEISDERPSDAGSVIKNWISGLFS